MKRFFGFVFSLVFLAGAVFAQAPVKDEEYERALVGLIQVMNQTSSSMEPIANAIIDQML